MTPRTWRDVRTEADLSEHHIAEHRQQLDEAVRAYRLAEVHRRQELAQEQVTTAVDVRQPRVSPNLESGDLSHVEMATLRSYITTLDGCLRVVAEFSDDQLLLGN